MMRSRHSTAGRLGALAVAASLALPAAAMGEETLFGRIEGRTGYVVSHDFAATAGITAEQLDRYDSRAADDFEVPAKTTWHVRQIWASGNWHRFVKVQGSNQAYYVETSTSDMNSGAADLPIKVRVTVHADAGGRPGVALHTDQNGQSCGTMRASWMWPVLTGEQPICRGSHGTLATRFTKPLVLGPGRYWVSFQVEADPRVPGEWFWGVTRWHHGCLDASTWHCYGKAHWQNPGGGYGTACTRQWGPMYDCVRTYDRSTRCAAAAGGVTASTPVCEARFPSFWGAPNGHDLQMLIEGTATT